MTPTTLPPRMHKIDALDTIWHLLHRKGYTAEVTAYPDGRFQIGNIICESSTKALMFIAMLEDRTPKLKVITTINDL